MGAGSRSLDVDPPLTIVGKEDFFMTTWRTIELLFMYIRVRRQHNLTLP